MTPEELLKPRYKVVADYPYSCLSTGFIVSEPVPIVHPQAIAGSKMQLDYFDKYPHLFKKLEWHEERTLDDLVSVKFVKVIIYKGYWRVGDIVKISNYIIDKGIFISYLLEYSHEQQPFTLLPATEEEYLNQSK